MQLNRPCLFSTSLLGVSSFVEVLPGFGSALLSARQKGVSCAVECACPSKKAEFTPLTARNYLITNYLANLTISPFARLSKAAALGPGSLCLKWPLFPFFLRINVTACVF